MQKVIKEISFTQKIVTSLYNNYAKLVFCDATRDMIQRNLLNVEEKNILSIVTSKTESIPDFFKKSYIIYLCNGILLEENIVTIGKIKDQLIFELAVQLLFYNLVEKINYSNENLDLFSLCLNQPVNVKFDSVKKKDDNYTFQQDGTEILSLKKNIKSAITKDIDFLDNDRNPFNVNNEHPDVEFVAYDLKNKSKQEWTNQFKNACKIIKENVPEIYDEIYYFLDAIVPHGYEPNQQLSSSYSKSPGILYLSYTDTDITQAEALIHEVHHTIFNVIGWKYKLYNNDMSLKYYSAYRPDARHIHGCFLGLHAFVAVQNFYRKIAESGEFIETFFSLYLKNTKIISVLEKYTDFTIEGNLLFQDIKSRYYSDAIFFEEMSKKWLSIYQQAFERVKSHLEEAKKRNKILLY